MLHLLVTAMMKNAAKYEINIRIAKLSESLHFLNIIFVYLTLLIDI